jgi:hypothetical protein
VRAGQNGLAVLSSEVFNERVTRDQAVLLQALRGRNVLT